MIVDLKLALPSPSLATIKAFLLEKGCLAADNGLSLPSNLLQRLRGSDVKRLVTEHELLRTQASWCPETKPPTLKS